jgi:transcriptional regulator PpsR
VKRFSSPKRSLGELDTVAAASILAASADVALVMDAAGVIRDMAVSSPELAEVLSDAWVGQPWAATVTVESRPKIEALLTEEGTHERRWRQVSHSGPGGKNIPVAYITLKVGKKGRIVAIGRDLSAIETLQQRLVDAHQAVDREYARLRHSETRNRLLFQLASEALLIVDANSLRVVEFNRAAVQLLGLNARRVVGRPFPDGFDAESTQALAGMLANVRAGGRATDVRARLEDGSRELLVSASVFREERSTFLLVRASATDSVAMRELDGANTKYLDLVQASPDGFVIFDQEGRVITASPAFLELAQLTSEEQARGESLDSWLGRSGVDLNVLLSQLREHGTARLFATTLRGANGITTDVELSATQLPASESPCFGMSVRDVGGRIGAVPRTAPPLTRSVEQLTELVGRMPLKGIVRETSDIIERLCIEAALELTQDNRASAADMLGLSRQSLYIKLRRYGLGDLVSTEEVT